MRERSFSKSIIELSDSANQRADRQAGKHINQYRDSFLINTDMTSLHANRPASLRTGTTSNFES
jgi:hypothetical protein